MGEWRCLMCPIRHGVDVEESIDRSGSGSSDESCVDQSAVPVADVLVVTTPVRRPWLATSRFRGPWHGELSRWESCVERCADRAPHGALTAVEEAA